MTDFIKENTGESRYNKIHYKYSANRICEYATSLQPKHDRWTSNKMSECFSVDFERTIDITIKAKNW